MKSKVLMVLAGAALSSVAFAATPDTDRAYAAELSADAATRTSNLAAGMDHFKLTAGDSTLYIGGYEQVRWNSDWRSSSQTAPQENYTHGFNIVNTRVMFWGNTWTKELTYKIDFQLGGGGNDEGTKLKDAEFRYTWDNGFYVRGGQFKLPGLREELVSDQFQLAVNRSATHSVFTLGRSQGVELGYTAEQFRIMGDFSNGINQNGNDYNAANQADWAFTGRAEFQAMGTDWSRWNDFTSWRESDSNGLLIGVAGHYESMGRTGPGLKGSSDNNSMWTYTVDGSYEASGWNLFGAFVGRHIDRKGSPKLDDFAWLVQGGVFVTDQVELFGRYDGIRIDKDYGVSNRTVHFLTFGGNYYVSPRSHTFKLSADIVWSLSKNGSLAAVSGSSGGNTAVGVLGQDKKGEIALAVQAQVCW